MSQPPPPVKDWDVTGEDIVADNIIQDGRKELIKKLNKHVEMTAVERRTS